MFSPFAYFFPSHPYFIFTFFINLKKGFFQVVDTATLDHIFSPLINIFPQLPTFFVFSQYLFPTLPYLSQFTHIFGPLTHIFPQKWDYFLYTSSTYFTQLPIFFPLIHISYLHTYRQIV